jgi:hypothetical protein
MHDLQIGCLRERTGGRFSRPLGSSTGKIGPRQQATDFQMGRMIYFRIVTIAMEAMVHLAR